MSPVAENIHAEAIGVVARRLIANASVAELNTTALMDELNESDWDTLCARVGEIARSLDPATENFDAAVEFLASRKAETKSRDHHESLYGRCTACGMTWETWTGLRASPGGTASTASTCSSPWEEVPDDSA